MQFYLSIISNKARRRGQRILVKLSNVSSHSTVATIYIHVLSCLSGVRLLATPWTVVCQASQSMGFSRQEYWSGLPFPSPGDLPDPGIESVSLGSPAVSLPLVPPGKPFNTHCLGSIRPKGKRARSSEQKMILGIVQLLT